MYVCGENPLSHLLGRNCFEQCAITCINWQSTKEYLMCVYNILSSAHQTGGRGFYVDLHSRGGRPR